jgi:hypothetical protein
MDTAWTKNTALCKAYCASREGTAALKATVDTLMKKINENITMTVPPLPETSTSSNAMEEMTMPLAHIQHDIEDILDAIRNPPGKRKQYTSNQDNKPTMLTNQGLATQQYCDALPEHSLMHSYYPTSAI